jgi:hypothetical protein
MMAQMTQAAFTIGAAFFIAVILMSITGRNT